MGNLPANNSQIQLTGISVNISGKNSRNSVDKQYSLKINVHISRCNHIKFVDTLENAHS